MWQRFIIEALKDFLVKSEIKNAIFKAIDKSVKDTKSPIDDKVAEIVKSVYDVIVGVL